MASWCDETGVWPECPSGTSRQTSRYPDWCVTKSQRRHFRRLRLPQPLRQSPPRPVAASSKLLRMGRAVSQVWCAVRLLERRVRHCESVRWDLCGQGVTADALVPSNAAEAGIVAVVAGAKAPLSGPQQVRRVVTADALVPEVADSGTFAVVAGAKAPSSGPVGATERYAKTLVGATAPCGGTGAKAPGTGAPAPSVRVCALVGSSPTPAAVRGALVGASSTPVVVATAVVGAEMGVEAVPLASLASSAADASGAVGHAQDEQGSLVGSSSTAAVTAMVLRLRSAARELLAPTGCDWSLRPRPALVGTPGPNRAERGSSTGSSSHMFEAPACGAMAVRGQPAASLGRGRSASRREFFASDRRQSTSPSRVLERRLASPASVVRTLPLLAVEVGGAEAGTSALCTQEPPPPDLAGPPAPGWLPEVGDVVRFHGLVRCAAFNGQQGVVLELDSARQRCLVRRSDGKVSFCPLSCMAPACGAAAVRLPAGGSGCGHPSAGHEHAAASADQGQLAAGVVQVPLRVDGGSQGGSVQLVAAPVATTALVPTSGRVRCTSCPPVCGRPDRTAFIKSETWLRHWRLSVVFRGWRRVAQRGSRPAGLGGRHEVRFEQLWWQSSEEELYEVFAAYGQVRTLERWRDAWGDYTGAGSCAFLREVSARQDVEALNGRAYGGTSVAVYLHGYGHPP